MLKQGGRIADGVRWILAGGPADAQHEEQREHGRWLAPAGALAAISMGVALQISSGGFQGDALRGVVLAFVLLLAGVVLPRPARFASLDRGLVPLLIIAGLFVQVGLLYSARPERYIFVYRPDLLAFRWIPAAIAVVAGGLLWRLPLRAATLLLGAIIAVHFVIGLSLIGHPPDPMIDVYIFQRDSIEALMAGVNPYTLTFPDIYAKLGSDLYYGPGLSLNGRLQFGFPYFPLSLLVAAPGQLIGQDPRYAQLVAIELAAILMAFARVGRFGILAAVLYLTTPRIFYVLNLGWTEPFLVLGLAAVAFAACRDSRAVPWLFGAFLALKQYLIFAVPPAWLLLGSARNRPVAFLAKAALVAIAVTLPFVLWNPAAFWSSVVTLQFHQPFRPDALSMLAWWAQRGHAAPSALYSFLAAATTATLALWRLPRTAAGFSAAVAVTFLAFFVLNKQAFCNYYFFVVGATCVMVSACRPPGTARAGS